MIKTAIEATRSAGELAYRYFKTQSASRRITYKPDNSPVTRADIEAEKLARKIISKKFPDHGIIGEEFGKTKPDAKYQWVIDPVDGTKDFVRKIPFWSTLLAVLENGKPIIGISFFPAIDEFFIAQKGKGTFLNNKKTNVSRVSNIKLAFVTHGSINRFEKFQKLKGLVQLCQTVQGRRNYGDLGFSLLLKGHVDAVLETGEIQDFAAPSLLVQEAGGKFTDFSGKFSLTSGNGIATNGLLHNQVLKILNSR